MKRSLVVFVALGLLAGLVAVAGGDESDEIVALETQIRQVDLENIRLDVQARALEERVIELEAALDTYLSGQLEGDDGNEDEAQETTEQGTSAAGFPQEALGFGTGQWRVGVDIRPGVYKSEPVKDSFPYCVWSTYSNFTRDNANNVGSVSEEGAPIYAEIFESDVLFSSDGCKPWIRLDD